MSIEHKADGDGPLCPECDAPIMPDRPDCWLCGARLADTEQVAAPSPPPVISPPHSEPVSFALSTLMLIVTLAAVCFGLLMQAPGLAIPMCVLLIPVFVRTVKVVRRREAAGLPVSVPEKIGMFAGSFGVAALMATVVVVAAFCSFCGVCLLAVSVADQNYGGAEMALWGFGVCAVAAAAITAIVFIGKWMRRRYERDTRGF